MGKIFYLMGKSASGKDTLYRRLQEECPDLKSVVLYTTRPKRDGETDGVEYFFVTEEQMEFFKNQGKVIEARTYQTVHGPWTYATVDDGKINLNNNYLVIGTLESYEKMRDYFGNDRVEPFYVSVDDGMRLERALMRERQQKVPRYQELCRRFLADEVDFSEENKKRCGIVTEYNNEDLEGCVAALKQVIEQKTVGWIDFP